MTPLPTLLTANEVAEEFRLSPETVRRWARRGRVQVVKLPSGGLRFRRADVEAIIATQDSTA